MLATSLFSLRALACILACFQLGGSIPTKDTAGGSLQLVERTFGFDRRGTPPPDKNPKAVAKPVEKEKIPPVKWLKWGKSWRAKTVQPENAEWTEDDIQEYAMLSFKQLPDSQVLSTVVAVLWVPADKIITLATVPRDDPNRWMDRRGKVDAPCWWSYVKDRKAYDKQHKEVTLETKRLEVIYHAEDLAMAWYEDGLTKKLAPGGKYPAGSYISIYGRKFPGETPRFQNPCVGKLANRAFVDPPCTAILAATQIKYDFADR